LSQANPNFQFELIDRISKLNIEKTEERLGLKFPVKLWGFYENVNGLITKNPSFEIMSIDKLMIKDKMIHFATFNNTIEVCFKTDQLNEANEWSIFEKESKFEITKTISSFWSNKIWHWLEKKNKIWADNWWE